MEHRGQPDMSGSDLNNANATSVKDRWLSSTRPCMTLLAKIGPKSSSEEISWAQQRIDDEIKAASLAICALRSRMNELSLTALLPPEMLARIFYFSALVDPPKGGYNAPLRWVTVTHVCRTWRQVALQHSTLWRNIPFSLGRTWTSTFLTRAKSTPVLFQTSVDPPKRRLNDVHEEGPFDLDVIVRHLCRTAGLKIYGTETSLEAATRSLTRPAPRLENLVVINRLNTLNNRTPTRPFLPLNFLGNDAVSLRCITLKEVSFSWVSLAFRTLSSLDITLSQGEDHSNIAPRINNHTAFSDLLSTLQVLINLEKLALNGCIPMTSPVADLAVVKVDLPRLTSLRLAGPAENCVALWRFLHIPPFARLRLECSFTKQTVQDIFALINAHLSAPERAAVPILTFRLSPSNSTPQKLTALAWRHAKSNMASSDAFHFPEDPDVKLCLFTLPGFQFPDDVAQKMCNAFPSEHLRSLHVQAPAGNTAWTKQHWIERFGRSKALEHVCIAHPVAVGFCRALIGLTSKPPFSGNPKVDKRMVPRDNIFLPTLRYVSLVDVDFRTARGTKPLWRQLPEWLGRRRTFGAPLTRLDTNDCEIEEDWVETLACVVPVVMWEDSEYSVLT
ncbi:hypothetical protein OF83DRAFT_305724 [Amylostereum chailletii]|nr:hypothetical protein OF83DRAFT_305724 [Amylostereum chailletii]